jgi:hypothetical protein
VEILRSIFLVSAVATWTVTVGAASPFSFLEHPGDMAMASKRRQGKTTHLFRLEALNQPLPPGFDGQRYVGINDRTAMSMSPK